MTQHWDIWDIALIKTLIVLFAVCLAVLICERYWHQLRRRNRRHIRVKRAPSDGAIVRNERRYFYREWNKDVAAEWRKAGVI